MKKQHLINLLGLAVFFIFPYQLLAQTNSLSTTVDVDIISPSSISDNSYLLSGTSLNFGALTISNSVGGTCILSTFNTRSVTGGVVVVNSSVSSNASFVITGKANGTYVIALPTNDVFVTRATGTEKMIISNLTARPISKNTDQFTGTFDNSGSDSFVIGGTLTIDAAQPVGIYNGTFSVTSVYN